MSNQGLKTRAEDYAQWYLDVVHAADMAEHAPVRGCMIIKPWGYGIWERMQRVLDGHIKDTGHEKRVLPDADPAVDAQKEPTTSRASRPSALS